MEAEGPKTDMFICAPKLPQETSPSYWEKVFDLGTLPFSPPLFINKWEKNACPITLETFLTHPQSTKLPQLEEEGRGEAEKEQEQERTKEKREGVYFYGHRAHWSVDYFL